MLTAERIEEIAKIVVHTAFEIHRDVGSGVYESVYQRVLFDELSAKGLKVEAEKAVPVIWEGKEHLPAFRADLLVENAIFVEIKSTKEITYHDVKQVLTYLRLTHHRLGFIVNFGLPIIKIRRVVNGMEEWKEREAYIRNMME